MVLSLQVLGAGVLHRFGAEFFSVFFGSYLPERWNFHSDSWYNYCADFGALIVAQISTCVEFYAQKFAQIFGAQCADHCTDYCADFLQIFLPHFGAFKINYRSSRVTQKCAENLQRNPWRPNGLSREGSLLNRGCLE